VANKFYYSNILVQKFLFCNKLPQEGKINENNRFKIGHKKNILYGDYIALVPDKRYGKKR